MAHLSFLPITSIQPPSYGPGPTSSTITLMALSACSGREDKVDLVSQELIAVSPVGSPSDRIEKLMNPRSLGSKTQHFAGSCAAVEGLGEDWPSNAQEGFRHFHKSACYRRTVTDKHAKSLQMGPGLRDARVL